MLSGVTKTEAKKESLEPHVGGKVEKNDVKMIYVSMETIVCFKDGVKVQFTHHQKQIKCNVGLNILL